MCGICGTFAISQAPAFRPEHMRGVRDSMMPRGPDSYGEWMSPSAEAWLGHRRLAIIDLSLRGHQPMLSADGTVTITFNGEIYNHEALRAELKAKGHLFSSHSDTEVIIESYRAWGVGCVERLRGMFAFAIWDDARKELLMARDPYGIKPLFYTQDRDGFTFASTVKALATLPNRDRKPSAAGLAGFFVFGSVPEPWTIYEGIKALPAGSVMRVGRDGCVSITRYAEVPRILSTSEAEARQYGELDADELQARFSAAMLDSVRHHLVSDVPVGAFLSAGVDSSSLVGLMRDAGQSTIKTITLTYAEFEGSPSNEGPLAAHVARHYGTEHTERVVTAAEFEQELPRIVAAMDQPSIDGINTYFVSKATHELGLKVAISGVGGDELLGGYPTFQSVPRLAHSLAPTRHLSWLAGSLEGAVRLLGTLGLPVHPKYGGLLRYGASIPGSYLLKRGLFLPADLGPVMADPEMLQRGLQELQPLELLHRVAEAGPSSGFGKVAALESCFYLRNQLLRDSDWASMAHSLELRTPLVDADLLRRVAPLMFRERRPSGKVLLANAPSKPVPSEIVNRPKTGFQIPVEKWLQRLPARGTEAAAQLKPFGRQWAKQVASMQHVL